MDLDFLRSLASIVPPLAGERELIRALYGTRSPDGDGLPMVKGLEEERAVSFPARGDESHQSLTPQQADVHARRGADRNDDSLLKPADGSNPSESLTLTAANELHIEERRRDVRRRSDRDAAAMRYLRKVVDDKI